MQLGGVDRRRGHAARARMAAATSGAASISPVPEIASSSRGVSSCTIDRPKHSFSNRSSRRSMSATTASRAATASGHDRLRARLAWRANSAGGPAGPTGPSMPPRRVDERVGHAAHGGRDDDDAVALRSMPTVTSVAAWAMRSADPTEVPPNFMTMSIWRDRLLTKHPVPVKAGGTGRAPVPVGNLERQV